MHNVENGRRPSLLAVTRTGLVSVALLLSVALSACTTAEGTNALADPGTFEREVMTSTLQGLSLVPQDEKPDIAERRGPLVMPKAGTAAPLPQPETQVAQLPPDSNTVRIDTTNISEADMTRLRNARVVDLRTLGGRPLTDIETKQLTARMNAANMATRGNTKKPLYFPPDEYFVNVGGTDLICKTPSGELVKLSDARCPPEIRKAMSRKIQPTAPSDLSPTSALSKDLDLDHANP
ncbi:MAG TPA: hypothetical protein VGM83_21000 [Devosiaceae bacterium]|jgi:hypothetical protein